MCLPPNACTCLRSVIGIAAKFDLNNVRSLLIVIFYCVMSVELTIMN